MRHCPRCTFALDAFEHGGIELDHCHRCGGTFLDPHEEAAMLGASASPANWLDADITKAKGSSGLICPHDRATMNAFELEFDGESVEVDVCPRCAGLWLDAQEGLTLRHIVMVAGQHPDNGLAESRSAAAAIRDYVFQLLSGFPMEVWNPIHKTAWITIATIALLFAVFLLARADASSALGFAMVPEDVLQGKRLFTLLTSSFLHFDWFHILSNAYFLYVFGDNIEDTLGGWRFALIYVVAGIAGSLLQALTQTDPSLPSLGASDAVAGMMGAYFMLFRRVKLYLVFFLFRFKISALWYLAFWIGLNLIYGLANNETAVAWMAHVGGFAAGAALGYAFRPKSLVERFKKTTL